MAYRLAPQAEADLEEIAVYVFHETSNIDVADRVVLLIAERFDLLAEHPRAGRHQLDDANVYTSASNLDEPS